MAVGPKYLKYGTWVRLLELKEVRPKQNRRGQYRDMDIRQAWEPHCRNLTTSWSIDGSLGIRFLIRARRRIS